VKRSRLETWFTPLQRRPTLQDGICFAACQSGLYRSDDGGGTWGYAYDSLKMEELLGTTAVSVSPDFDSDRSVFAGAQGAVLHSANGGESWGVVLPVSPPPLVSAMAVSPNFAEDGTLFVGTMEAAFFSLLIEALISVGGISACWI
jgi:photosystem II stability/assembly factor-like uncharacterized protein